MKAMRNIFVVGLGNFGFHCAKKLQGKADVTAIDIRREAVQRIGPYVSRAIVGDATRGELLQELGIESADAIVISMGQSLEASILVTLHAQSLGAKEIFVKALSTDHAEILSRMGATRVLHPEREIAENLAISISRINITDYLRLHENFAIIEVTTPEAFVGKSLIDLDLRSRFDVTVIAIFRAADRLVNPSPTMVIQEGDRLAVLGEESKIMEFEAKII